MWAAFKSDLKEFASGAAEETTAVASKVGVNVNVGGDGGGGVSSRSGSGQGGGGQSASSSEGQQHRSGVVDGSVLFANTAISMGEKGLRGLQGMSSMMGGMVAPRNVGPSSGPVGINPAASSFATNAGGGKHSAALTSMLAAGEEDEEEEELGWDDDDDEDLDVEAEEADVGSGDGGEKKDASVTRTGPADFFDEHLCAEEKQTASDSDGEALKALQSKLDMVEKSRAQLQSEHRRQTAELVELRAKVEEMDTRGAPAPTTAGDDTGGHKEEVRTLQNEIEQLKMQLSKSSKEIDPDVAALVQEKELLERELLAQKEENRGLELRNKVLQLQEQAELASDDKAASDKQTKQQQQIEELTSELQSLQANLDSANIRLEQAEEHSSQQVKLHEEATQRHTEETERLEAFLAQVEKSHALTLKEAEQSNVKLASLEREIEERKCEMEAQASKFATKLREEVERAKITMAMATASPEGDKDCRGKELEEPPTGKANEDTKKEENPTVKLSDDSAEELSDDWGDEW